jgi:hypothetical protein
VGFFCWGVFFFGGSPGDVDGKLYRKERDIPVSIRRRGSDDAGLGFVVLSVVLVVVVMVVAVAVDVVVVNWWERSWLLPVFFSRRREMRARAIGFVSVPSFQSV